MSTRVSNMKIGARLGLAFGALLALMVGVAIVGVMQLYVMDGALTDAVDVSGSENRLVSQALESAQEAVAAMRNCVALSDDSRKAAEKRTFDSGIANYESAAKKLDTLFGDDPGVSDDERNFLKELKAAHDSALPVAKKVFTLGLANDPLLKKAAIEAIEKFGVGAGASRLVSGTQSPHVGLEAALAKWKRAPAALAWQES